MSAEDKIDETPQLAENDVEGHHIKARRTEDPDSQAPERVPAKSDEDDVDVEGHFRKV